MEVLVLVQRIFLSSLLYFNLNTWFSYKAGSHYVNVYAKKNMEQSKQFFTKYYFNMILISVIYKNYIPTKAQPNTKLKKNRRA